MAARRRSISDKAWEAPAPTSAATRIAPADPTHESVASPATLLQERLGAAMSSPWQAQAAVPAVERWPGSVRILVLAGSAAASWALVWEAIRRLA